jgi:pyrroline-5-carboxylate reductase
MTIQSVGFIGCGRIARVLLGGFKAALRPDAILVSLARVVRQNQALSRTI